MAIDLADLILKLNKFNIMEKTPFNSYKELFKTETGLDADENIGLYIQYYTGIINHKCLQTLIIIANKGNV